MKNYPCTEFDELWHIGEMDSNKRGFNRKEYYEGHCLSVSDNPELWAQILNLKDAPWWKLKKKDAKFLYYYGLNKCQKKFIEIWGIKNGYAEPSNGWEMPIWDTFEDTYKKLISTDEAEAKELADVADIVSERIFGGPTTDLMPATILLPLERLNNHVKFPPHPAHVLDSLVLVYAESVLKIDGVWWEDKEIIEIGQAPRGGIFPSCIDTWEIEKVKK